ncbi:Neurogenic protein big brain, partial [Fragariocoptes setiger]
KTPKTQKNVTLSRVGIEIPPEAPPADGISKQRYIDIQVMRFRLGRRCRRTDALHSLARPANQLVRHRIHNLPFSTMPAPTPTNSDAINGHHHHNNNHNLFISANNIDQSKFIDTMSPVISPSAPTTASNFATHHQHRHRHQHQSREKSPSALRSPRNELCSTEFYRSLLAECLGSCIYIFIVCSARISWTGSLLGHTPNIITMALASGLAMQLLIYTFRSIHINPALTISMFLLTKISLVRTVAYVAAQCVGGIAASSLLYLISVRGHAGALGVDNPHDKLHVWHVLTVEIVISLFVTLVTYAAFGWSKLISLELERVLNTDYCCLSYKNKNFNDTAPYESADKLWPRLRNRRNYHQVSDNLTSMSGSQQQQLRQQQPQNATRQHSTQRQSTTSNIDIFNQQPYLISNHYDRVSDDSPPHTVGATLIGIDSHTSIQQTKPNARNNNCTNQVMSSLGPSMLMNGGTGSGDHLLLGDSIDCSPTDISATMNQFNKRTRPFSTIINPGGTNDVTGQPTILDQRASILDQQHSYQQQPSYYYTDNCCSTTNTDDHHLVSALGVDIDHQPHNDTDIDDGYDNHQIYATQHRLRQEQEQQHQQSPTDVSMPWATCDRRQCSDPIDLLHCPPNVLSAGKLNANGFPVYLATSNYAFAIGCAYALASLTGIPASGASLNPARSFGPAFIMNRWTNHWIYWLGPVLGAILGAFLYEFVLDPLRRNTSLCSSLSSNQEPYSAHNNNGQHQQQYHQAASNFLYQHPTVPANSLTVLRGPNGPSLLKANIFGADSFSHTVAATSNNNNNNNSNTTFSDSNSGNIISTSTAMQQQPQHLTSRVNPMSKSQPSMALLSNQQRLSNTGNVIPPTAMNFSSYTNAHNQLSSGPNYFATTTTAVVAKGDDNAQHALQLHVRSTQWSDLFELKYCTLARLIAAEQNLSKLMVTCPSD